MNIEETCEQSPSTTIVDYSTLPPLASNAVRLINDWHTEKEVSHLRAAVHYIERLIEDEVNPDLIRARRRIVPDVQVKSLTVDCLIPGTRAILTETNGIHAVVEEGDVWCRRDSTSTLVTVAKIRVTDTNDDPYTYYMQVLFLCDKNIMYVNELSEFISIYTFKSRVKK